MSEFDKVAEDYNKLLQSQHKIFGNVEYYSTYKVLILKKYIPNANRILEFGCGIGRNLPYLIEAYPQAQLYGYDISHKSLQIAQENNPQVKFIYEIRELENMVNFFDVIFVAGVYHHVPPDERDFVTLLIYKILQHHGKVIIFEHNPYNPITRKLVRECEFDKDAILLTRNELIKLFLERQFKLVKSDYTLFLPPILGFLNFIEKFMGFLPLGGQYYGLFTRD